MVLLRLVATKTGVIAMTSAEISPAISPAYFLTIAYNSGIPKMPARMLGSETLNPLTPRK